MELAYKARFYKSSFVVDSIDRQVVYIITKTKRVHIYIYSQNSNCPYQMDIYGIITCSISRLLGYICGGPLQYSPWTDILSTFGIRPSIDVRHHIVLHGRGLVNKSARLLDDGI